MGIFSPDDHHFIIGTMTEEEKLRNKLNKRYSEIEKYKVDLIKYQKQLDEFISNVFNDYETEISELTKNTDKISAFRLVEQLLKYLKDRT
jgi:transcription antitermination factor NusA-like protein